MQKKKGGYKNKQSSYDTKLIDPLDKDNDIKKIKISPFKQGPNNEYPYMDTLKYYDGYVLSSSSKDIDFKDGMYLEDTEGGYEPVGEFSSHYGEYINTEADDVKFCQDVDEYRYIDDCFYSRYYDRWMDYENALENGTNCDYADDEDNYRKNGDYVVLSDLDTATSEYAQKHFKYSYYSDCWVKDYVFSNTYNTYLNRDDSVEVFLDLEKTNTDWRDEDDGTYFQAEDGTLYDSKLYEEVNKNKKI